MRKANKILFELLSSVLFNKELDQSTLSLLDKETLEYVYDVSKKHDIAHIIGASLDKYGLLGKDEMSKKFAKAQFIAVYRYENIAYEYQRIRNVLESEGIEYIPLKGSVIRDLYPEPWMRTSCDIDMLVRESDLERATEALQRALAYECRGKNSHDMSMYSESGVHFELHYCLEENIELLDRGLKRVWEYVQPKNGCECKLDDSFFIFHIIAHASYHFVQGGCGIRAFIDLAMLEEMNYDREKVMELCRQSGIDKFYDAATSLSKVWFCNEEHTDLTLSMEKYVISGGTYGTMETHVIARQEVKGGKIGYVLSRIFVPYDFLKLKYPSIKYRIQVPFYQARRCVELLLKKRLKVSVHEFNTNINLDKKAIDETCMLMNCLNLNEIIQ